MHSSLAVSRRHLRCISLKSLCASSSPSLTSRCCIRSFITRTQSTTSSLVVSLKPATRRILPEQRPLSLNTSHTHNHTHGTRPLHSSAAALLLVAVAAGLVYTAYHRYTLHSGETTYSLTQDLSPEDIAIMTAEVAPGRPGSLTSEQEEKLKQMWKLIFQVCQVGVEPTAAAAATPAADASSVAAEDDSKKAKKTSRMSIFSRKNKSSEESSGSTASSGSAAAPPNAPVFNLSKDGEADKYGQTKQFYETLASQSPESIRDTIWSMVKHDHPDALVLRFLRARKWDVEKAVVMLVSTMNWRAAEMKVDEDIMRHGEGWAVETEKDSSDPAKQKLAHDFLAQIRKGISYVHGCDKQGRPLCIVNARMHRQGEQTEESLERYTVYLIETCRMLLQPPVDTAEDPQTIVFDMTGFSMANMDYTPVKFMIKCFEANYPECLGTVLVHKAPWIFQGIWKVIRGWLDPVVANKVHFTNNATEMQEFIPLKHIPSALEGEENWTYQYVEPVAGENDKLKDVETRDKLLAERAKLYKEYEDATLAWIKGDNVNTKRDEIAERMKVDYWKVDPYVRSRSFYDRTGVLLPGGGLNWYPAEKTANGEVKEEVKAETQADDVD
ncbi:cral trio domain protein [Cladorrhinum sp. PSN259]|nr:cral trio domain protein [Cladorrhinum sp. PSN259]